MAEYEVRGAIKQVLASWALGYDTRDVDRMAACFTEDAEMVLDIAGHERMGPYVGHAEVMAHFTDHHEIQTDQRRHVTTNVVVEDVETDRARSTSYLVLFVTEDDTSRLQATGVYRDQFVRTAAGWQISRRELRLDVHY